MNELNNQTPTETATEKKRYGVYLAPNLVTTTALLFGFYAILAAINEDFQRAAICVFVAMLLDGLDGRVARLVGGESAFGEQYDSMSDLISFGVAPAILMYQWSLRYAETVAWLPEKLSWMIPFVYAACAALRLARFNTQIGHIDSRFFIGLPSPSAAGVTAGFVWFGVEYEDIIGSEVIGICMLLTLFAGVMMVAPIKYFSFKDFDIKGKMPFVGALLLVVMLALISINPATVLWLLFLVYSLHGPVRKCYTFMKKR